MSPHNQEARAKALEYLKSRGIYILDGRFKPTGTASTDVAKTMARYRMETTKQSLMRKVK